MNQHLLKPKHGEERIRRDIERNGHTEREIEEKGRKGGREKRKEMSRVMPGVRAVNMGEIGENHRRQ